MDRVIEWYEKKTKSIIEKYGPGPLIHFHTGYFEQETQPSQECETLRRQMIDSQTKMLDVACGFWGLSNRRCILDFGCGLGGGSIYFAQNFGSIVYALTNVPPHISYIEQFANTARVSNQIKPILGDESHIPLKRKFDAVVAVESSCYLDRSIWFKTLAKRLKQDGIVCIADSFTSDIQVKTPFDEYWLTNIGSLAEYCDAASLSGLKIDSLQDITDRTEKFWEFNVLHSLFLLNNFEKSPTTMGKLQKSIEWQSRLHDFWKTHRIHCLLLRFSKELS